MTNYEDADTINRYQNDNLNFKYIVLQHLQRISQFASCEFHGGFWEKKVIPHPNMNIETKTYIPDTREIYSNAVDCLLDLLYPYFDKKMIQEYNESKEKLKIALKETSINIVDGLEYPTDEKKQFKGVDERMSYRTRRVLISRDLFRNMCCFLYRNNYLELGDMRDN